jgi:site-specific DNA recombinase
MSERFCGLYGRVSTARQAEVIDGGLDTQFDLMARRVEWENDSDNENTWVVVDRYREEGFSGKNLERPEFRRIVEDIKAGRVNTVVVQKIDRITRSLRDFFDLWEFFERHGVQFISLHEKFDTTTAVGRAMLKLILVFAELEREQTSERTAATLAYRARQGLRNGGRIYGYDLDPDNKGVLKIVPEQAEHVLHDFFEKCV